MVRSRRSRDALQDGRRGPVPRRQPAAQAIHECKLTIRNLNRRMCLPAQLAYRLNELRNSPAVCGVVVTERSPVRVDRQIADAGDQVAFRNEAATVSLQAKAEILELDQHADREAVIE